MIKGIITMESGQTIELKGECLCATVIGPERVDADMQSIVTGYSSPRKIAECLVSSAGSQIVQLAQNPVNRGLLVGIMIDAIRRGVYGDDIEIVNIDRGAELTED